MYAAAPEDEVASKAMEILLGYYADQDHLAEKEEVVIKQALIYGVSPAKNAWYYQEADKTSATSTRSTRRPGQTVWRKTRAKIIECDRPCFTPWDAYDVLVGPVRPQRRLRRLRRAARLADQGRAARSASTTSSDGTGTYKNLDLLFSEGAGDERPPTPAPEPDDAGRQNITRTASRSWKSGATTT